MSAQGYFDYNATTPVCPEAVDAFNRSLEDFGNPSSKHALAKQPKQRLAQARGQVARLLGADDAEIVFTSGGTEANNWAIKGAVISRGATGGRFVGGHLIVSEIEHASVLEVARYLERVFGFEVTRLRPDAAGLISVASVEAALRPDTQLVAVMLMNNEVGTIQPVESIARLLRARGVHFHVDGVQAVGKIEIDVHALGVDTFAFAAHKFHGPKGVGGLYIRSGVAVEPLLHGGGQEQGRRGGTEAVAAISAMGAAAEVTQRILPALIRRTAELSGLLRRLLVQRLPGITFNGPVGSAAHAPNTLSLCVPGVRAEALAAILDYMHGIRVSLGSACSNNKAVSLSHVLVAMGLSEAAIKGTLRVSLGLDTQEEDVTAFVHALVEGVGTLQRISAKSHHETTAAA